MLEIESMKDKNKTDTYLFEKKHLKMEHKWTQKRSQWNLIVPVKSPSAFVVHTFLAAGWAKFFKAKHRETVILCQKIPYYP